MAHFPRTSLSEAALRSSVPQARDAVVAAVFRRHRTVPPPPIRRAGRSAGRRALACAAACALLLALLPACRRDAPPTAAAAPADPPAAAPAAPDNDKNKENRPVDAHAPSKQSEQPPAPDAVLYFIYNKDGDGATSYEIENGSIATYWYGHAFELGGTRYFTGFAYDTPEKYSSGQTAATPDPLTKVTLTQATFVESRPGTPKPWSFQGAERSIGEFGGSEKGNALDASRKAIDFRTADGRLLLAVPAIADAPVADTRVFSMFVFDPRESEDTSRTHWTYLGDVLAGNAVGRFAPRGNDAMPAFETGGGQIAATSGERVEIPETYVYDELNNAYLELQ